MAAGLPTYTVEIEFTAGVWTDVTSRLVDATGIDIHHGRADEFGVVQASTLALALENYPDLTTGICPFTPDNVLSPYFPNVVKGRRIRVKVTRGGTTWQRFIGKITAWQPNLSSSLAKSTVAVSAIDQLGDFQNRKMMSAWAEYWRYAATWYLSPSPPAPYDVWPLDDSTNALSLRNVYPTGAAAEIVNARTGTGSVVLGSNPPGLLVEGVVTLTHDTTASRFGPYIQVIPSWGASPSSAQFMFAFRTTDATVGESVLLTLYSDTPKASSGQRPNAPVGQLRINNGTLTWYKADLVTSSVSFSGTFNDGLWHTVMLGSYAGGTAFFLDGGRQLGGQSYTASTENILSARFVTVGGQTKNAFGFSGDVACLAAMQYSFVGASGGFETPAIPGNTVVAGILLQYLLGFYLGRIPVNLTDWTQSGADLLPVRYDQTAGATFGDTFAKLATTTGATWWVRPTDGMPRWIAPAATRPITATATITLESDDDIGPGQAWMSGATSRPTRVTVSSPAGKVVVVDTVSEAAGAPVSEANLDTFSPTTTSAADPGYARLNQSTRLRLASFSVDLVTAQTDLYTALCGSSFPGMRLTVAGVPSAAFGYTTTDVYAQGWNEHIDSGSYVWKFDTTPADAPSDGRFDDATYGRFAWGDGAATVTGGTAVGTTSNGTLIITTPSGPCLSVSAGSFPLDLDWNGERVTITSAPASSTSPQTVTTTARGVGGTVARIHSTGEAVDIAFAARIAF